MACTQYVNSKIKNKWLSAYVFQLPSIIISALGCGVEVKVKLIDCMYTVWYVTRLE